MITMDDAISIAARMRRTASRMRHIAAKKDLPHGRRYHAAVLATEAERIAREAERLQMMIGERDGETAAT